MPGFLQLSAIPLALKREKLLKTRLMKFWLISAARQQEYVPFAHDPGEARVGDKSFAGELKCFRQHGTA